jgi:hypothetical protein
MSDRIVAQATELMRSGCPEGAAFYWAAILVGMRAALERRGNWRHAKWCSWERGAEADCNCGLDEVRAALALPTPRRFIGPGEGHQHVGPHGTVSCYASHAEPPHDLVPRAVPAALPRCEWLCPTCEAWSAGDFDKEPAPVALGVEMLAQMDRFYTQERTAGEECRCGHGPHEPGKCAVRYHVTLEAEEAGDPCGCGKGDTE